ncbi:hypothetical protein [Paenibacillus ginsengarvi]|uniref:Uridine kinase n=1 Tax=Paenibacillus ginsengarvi TaxID=400777 RepID=A0A3B0CK56_9BACL|nr:hypothetical protein [Paenibacillus ginsengarvi]RKN86055.1 hypothetical protein D7M11_03315 [Paenibacillus ginsengarvi]
MNIADYILKHHLKNVYVITGLACGGKSTVSKYLADKYDLILLDWDKQFASYQALVDPRYQPAMSRRPTFASWEEYFMRPPEPFSAGCNVSGTNRHGHCASPFPFREYGNKRIMVDGFFSVEILKEISDYSRVVFLLSSEEVVRHDYFNRECKRDMYECIKGLNDPEAAFENVFQTMFYKADENEKAIRESGFRWFKRETLGTDPMDTIKQIEEHFGFNK